MEGTSEAAAVRTQPPSFWSSLGTALLFVARGMLWGLVCGAVVGGLGGRLAMFVMRLTSDSSLHGVDTDDGFTIGQFSSDTIFLVVFTALLGAAAGGVYLAIRRWLPERQRAALFGVFCGAVGGALVVEPGGTDFTELSPLSLAIGLFVLIPALYGVALSLLVERSLRAGPLQLTGWRWLLLLPLAPLLLAGPFGVSALLITVVVVYANRSGRLLELWHSTVVAWVGRVAVAGVTVFSGVLLVSDAAEIL